ERLRHVPARVIACIGLNDDVFPRGAAAPDFDLIASGRRQGDPDPRRVDKQSFLDLLLAAQDRLILTYNGRSQKDNSERAPSVVLDALLNACVTTFTTGDTDAAADEHAVRHHFVVRDRKSTRLNSSHVKISYAVFCLKKKSVTNTQ